MDNTCKQHPNFHKDTCPRCYPIICSVCNRTNPDDGMGCGITVVHNDLAALTQRVEALEKMMTVVDSSLYTMAHKLGWHEKQLHSVLDWMKYCPLCSDNGKFDDVPTHIESRG